MATGDKFFFVRPQRTASTTLRQRMARHFGDVAIYPNGSDYAADDSYGRAAVSVDRLVERMTVRGRDVRVIAGHFPLSVAEVVGGDIRTFMILREPVARALSSLRHRRDEPFADRDKPLEAIYDKPGRAGGLWGNNHMTKMLCLTLDEARVVARPRVDITPERLEQAKQNLLSLDVVGVQERFEDFCDDLNREFGWHLGREPAWANPSTAIDVSDAFRQRIAEDNAADVELYDLALKIVEGR